jgi:hypothetical protein
VPVDDWKDNLELVGEAMCNVPRYSRLIIPTYFGWDKHKNPAVRKAGCFPHAMRYERC